MRRHDHPSAAAAPGTPVVGALASGGLAPRSWLGSSEIVGVLKREVVAPGRDRPKRRQARADRAPSDGRVLLQEWLDYATERVPQVQEEKMKQARNAGKDLAFVEGEESRELLKRNLQRPRAFYRRDLPVPLIAINQQAPRSSLTIGRSTR